MQAFVERLNSRFNSTNIANVDSSMLVQGQNVGDAAVGSAKGTGAIRATQAERDYVMKNFSAADLEELRRILHWAVTQGPRVPVQFLWVPGDRHQIEFWNVGGIEATRDRRASRGGISVLLRGPSPAKVTEHYP
jgi:hypothetical protein